MTWEVFSHEPEVVPAPGGHFVMYFTAQLRSAHGLCNCCRPGHGPCDGSTGTGDCGHEALASGDSLGSGSYMSYTTDPNGASRAALIGGSLGQRVAAFFSPHPSLLAVRRQLVQAAAHVRALQGRRYQLCATDFGQWFDRRHVRRPSAPAPARAPAPAPAPALRLLLLLLLPPAPALLPVGCCSPARVCARRWRHWGGGNGGSRQFLATASDWRDPSSYIQHNTELFPDLGAAGTEDQFVYQASAATVGL